MNRREAIIVIIALIIGGYAAADYFILSKKQGSSPQEQLQSKITKIEAVAAQAMGEMVAVNKVANNAHLPYILASLEGPWQTDPFIQYDPQADKGTSDLDEALPELVYSGFIRAGKRVLAVVNGMEYMVGETLKEVGFKLKSITASKVVLLTQANREVTLTLQEN